MTPASPRPVRRVTPEGLGPGYGADRGRPLVVSVQAGQDGTLITLRPLGTRRGESVLASDLYAYLVRCAANRAVLERARSRKAAKALARERASIKRAERRLVS